MLSCSYNIPKQAGCSSLSSREGCKVAHLTLGITKIRMLLPSKVSTGNDVTSSPARDSAN